MGTTCRESARWLVLSGPVLAVALAGVGGSARPAEKPEGLRVMKQIYGRMPDGGPEVDLYTLTNGLGLEARIMTLGATLTTVTAPDRHGQAALVTLHKDSFEEYLKGHPLFGSVVGRYANRIAGARFTIDGVEHRVEANAGKHHIHGGRKGFQWLVWKAEPIREDQAVGVRLQLTSPDGDAGFPGTVRVAMSYRLTQANELVMEYTATTDKPTHVNLTNHAYWNLAGAGDVMGHELFLDADHYLPSDADLIPTGEVRPVKGTPMDFTRARTIGSRIDQVDRRRYDHCYVLNRKPGQEPTLAARVVEPKSGRVMEVHTTQPGVQFYTGNPRGLCLETQHYPNTPNEPKFPSTLLRPGQTYREVTIHKFSVRK